MKITIKNLQKKIPVYPTRIKKSILKVLKDEGLKAKGEITVSFVSDRLISGLNARYLKKNGPTDVLAFNLSSPKKGKIMAAEIVVSVDTALRNSRIYKTTPFYEMNLYSIHGLLHLLGYNDNNPQNSRIMRMKEAGYVNPSTRPVLKTGACSGLTLSGISKQCRSKKHGLDAVERVNP